MANVGEAFAIVSIVGTLSGSVLYIFRSSLDHLRTNRNTRLQAEFYNKLLDRFGSSQDLLAYLQTEAGQSLLKSHEVEPRPGAPVRRILNSVQIGTILIAVGTAFLLIRNAIESIHEKEPLTVFGILGLMAGLGFLVSAFASWKLSKMWGLMNGKQEH